MASVKHYIAYILHSYSQEIQIVLQYLLKVQCVGFRGTCWYKWNMIIIIIVFSFVYNRLKLRIVVLPLPLNEPVDESAMLHHCVSSGAQTGQLFLVATMREE